MDRSARRDFRLSVSASEAPWVLAIAGAVFGIITILNAMSGPPMAVAVLVVNLGASALLLGGALVIRRLPVGAVPWLLALGAWILVLIGQVQVWVAPDPVAFVYLLLIIVVFPAFTLAWAPAAIVAVPMVVGCAVIALEHFPDLAGDWVIASAATLALGFALLWLRLRSIDKLGEQTALIGQLALRDQLTGVLNRHGFEEQAPELMALAARQHDDVFVMFADVDGLKAVNDQHGHGFGDAVIVATAQAIQHAVRASDLVGRWGGDEFVVLGLGRGADTDEIERRVAESLRDEGIDRVRWPGGVSIGMAASAGAPEDFEALKRMADADMYDRRRRRRARAVRQPVGGGA